MKKIVCLFVCLFAGTAAAIPITDTSVFTASDSVVDFDEVSISSGELVSNQYSAFGVEFTGGIYGGSGTYSAGDHVSGTYLDTWSGGGQSNFWSIEFTSIVTSAGAYFEMDSYNSLTLSAMLGGSLVETASFSDGVCCRTMEFAGFTGINFDSIEITGATGGNFYMDELHYSSTTSVPEPATLALLGLGLAGIGFSRKKKSV